MAKVAIAMKRLAYSSSTLLDSGVKNSFKTTSLIQFILKEIFTNAYKGTLLPYQIVSEY